jgi:hypothetical protein
MLVFEVKVTLRSLVGEFDPPLDLLLDLVLGVGEDLPDFEGSF